MEDDMRVFDWDDTIVNDGKQFVTLEEGIYEFEVTGLEKSMYEPSATSKLPRCNMAIVNLTVHTDEGDAVIQDKLQMCGKMEWKLAGFFRCIGLKEHGEALKMKWDQVLGRKGRAKITKTKGTKNDNTWFNNVGSYIDPIAKTKDEKSGDSDWS